MSELVQPSGALRGRTDRVVDLSVIIVSWNTRELLRCCLQKLEAELKDLNAEVFVVDNASGDGSAAMVAEEFPFAKLIANAENRGFAKANNQAMAQSCGRFVLLLNPDTEVRPGSLQTMMEFFDTHPAAGVVAPQLLNADGSIQPSCRQFPTGTTLLYEFLGMSRWMPDDPRFRQYKMLDFDHNHECQVDQPQGACLLVKREIINKIGMLDEGFFMLFEEVDWCYRIKQAGYEIWFTPKAQVLHHFGQSIKQVKPRMIVSSHKGFHRFWSKHLAGGFALLSPFVYCALMVLALVRIAMYELRKVRVDATVAALLSLAVCAVSFAIEGHKGLNLMDEGFLWYGAQRVFHGEVPLRDFMAYDIGRYYWVAGFMQLFQNTGIVLTRIATLVFGGLAVAAALFSLRRQNSKASFIVTAACAVLLAVWMVPRFKLYDIAASIAIVVSLASVLRQPTQLRFFVYGIVVGLCAVIGRNHGVYAVACALMAIPVLFSAKAPVNWLRSAACFAGGIFTGYLPVLASLAFVPGFREGMYNSIFFTLAAGPSIKFPVPWPWLVLSQKWFDPSQFGVGSFYCLLVAFDLLGLLWLVRSAVSRKPIGNPLLAACVLASICYSHHAFYGAGAGHLAQGIFPTLIGLSLLISQAPWRSYLKVAVLMAITGASVVATLSQHPAFHNASQPRVRYMVGSDRLLIDSEMAEQLKGIDELVAERARNGRVVFLPFWPSLYAMRGEKSPIFDIYAFFPRSEKFQREEIAQLEAFDPGLIILWNKPPEAQFGWKYERTNPLIDSWLKEDWKTVPCSVDLQFLTVYSRHD